MEIFQKKQFILKHFMESQPIKNSYVVDTYIRRENKMVLERFIIIMFL